MKKFKLLTLALVAGALLASCQKKPDNSLKITQRTARVSQNAANVGSSQGYYYTASTGSIYTNGLSADQFSQAMQYLASANIDLDNIGTISPGNVKLRGYIEVDSSGYVNTSTSSILIEIDDSFTGQLEDGQTIPPIQISVPATAGQAYNGQATVTFSDSYGSITLQGSYAGGSYAGYMSFQNNNGHQGSGFSYNIATCGFFRCQ